MPAWDEITPYTERGTAARRITVTNIILGLNIVGFFVTVLSHPLKFDFAFRNAVSFSFSGAVDGLALWQFVTYSFVHSIVPLPNLFPFLICCYLLYERGTELERDIGWRRFLALFLGAALYGAVAHAFVEKTFGAEAAMDFYGPVLAVLLVHALRAPGRTSLFLLVVPLRAITVAVLAGSLLLFYCVLWYRAGAWSLVGAACYALAMWKIEPSLDRLLAAAAQKRERARFIEEVEVRREVDRILEKISREGMESLDARERRLLKKASRLMQDGREQGND
jgi:membrane associated rhomboid family serine protease